jgi:DNA processing protein
VVDPLINERADAEALLLLQRIPGLADRGIGRLLESFGSGRGALAASGRRFTAEDRAAVGEALQRADAIGARVVPLGSPAYPARLLELVDPPPVLFLRGRTELLDGPAVAVVGSRRATDYGRRIATRLAEALARGGVVVVSGFALGVDGEAHRAALAAGGGTIAVLGSGPDVVHPRAHARLFREVTARGLIVTEFAPATFPLPHHFPRRNRIMAALAHAVVVVEAAERSGALITARHALDLGRDVLAVPGPIDAPTSAGANALIRDGAQPVLGAEDLFRALDLPAPVAAPAAPSGTDASAVWAALDAGPAGVDEVAARSGLSARRALAALSLLELDGWAVQSGGARFARRA